MKICSILLLLCFLPGFSLAQKKISITSTILPVHSLVNSIKDDKDRTNLLIKKGQDPHHYSLKPSDMENIKNADLIFLVSHNLEVQAYQQVTNLSKNVQLVELALGKRISKISTHHSDHHHGDSFDPHIWLSPSNAITISEHIAKSMSNINPEKASIYQQNSIDLITHIKNWSRKSQSRLAELNNKNYLSLHSGNQYYDTYFKTKGFLGKVGTSVKAASATKQAIRDNNISCAMIPTHLDKTSIANLYNIPKIEYFDLLGTNLDNHVDKISYLDIMGNIEENFIRCLDGPQAARTAK